METLHLPSTANASYISSNFLLNNYKLTFDFSTISADRTVNCPDSNTILPAFANGSIGLGVLNNLGTNNVLLGVNARSSANNCIVFGNATASVNNSLVFPSATTKFITSIGSLSSSKVLYYDPITGLITYGPAGTSEIPVGTVSAPGLPVTGHVTTGIFQAATNTLSFTSAATETFRFTHDQVLTTFDGSNNLPAYSFTSATNYGLYRVGANTLAFSANATAILQVDTALLVCISGTSSAPALSCLTDATSGIYKISANTIGFSHSSVNYNTLTNRIVTSYPYNSQFYFTNIKTVGFGLQPDYTLSINTGVTTVPSANTNSFGINSEMTLDFALAPVTNSTSTTVITPGVTGGRAGQPSVNYNASLVCIGIPNANSGKGIVYAYRKVAGTYGAPVTINPNATAALAGYCTALSFDGTTLAIGAPGDSSGRGAVFVYIYSSGSWSQQAKLVPAAVTTSYAAGSSVDITADGNTIVFGSPTASTNVGVVSVFTRSGVSWSEQNSFSINNAGDTAIKQGTSLAITPDGTSLIVGCPGGTHTGRVYILRRAPGTSFSAAGAVPLTGTGGDSSSFRGNAVAVSSDFRTIAFSSTTDTTNGAVWVFRSANGFFTQEARIVPSDGGSGTYIIGSALKLSPDGNRLYIGAPGINSGVGGFWVYQRFSSGWVEQGLYANGGGQTKQAGTMAVSKDLTTVISCSQYSGTSYDGYVLVFYGRTKACTTNQSIKAIAGSSTDLSYAFNSTSTGWYESGSNEITIVNAGQPKHVFNLSAVRPYTDNSLDLGKITNRFNNLYSANAVINTSDERQKYEIEDSDLGLEFLKQLKPKKYKMNNQHARGLIAQDIEEILPPNSDICVTKNDTKGIRYNELIPIMIKSIQELYKTKFN